MPESKIPFVDLVASVRQSREAYLAAFAELLDTGAYVGGPQVGRFESEFAAYCGASHAVAVKTGTDALLLALRALGIGPGDEVITAANSFIATGSAVALSGARPVFIDVGDDYNMDPALIEAALTPRTRAILPVHLTGRPADMD